MDQGAGISARIEAVVAAAVAADQLPGAAWRVERDGEVLARGAAGVHEPGGDRRITAEAVFRIASISKPVVAAAALALVDDGVLELDGAVDPLLPELADRRVLADPADPDGPTVPALRSITVRDLLTFRLGIGHDFTGPWPPPAAVLLDRAGLPLGPPAPQAAPPPDEWLHRLASVPLVAQPGERWLYHVGASVLGVLVSRAAGAPLPDVLAERICRPLGMRSTGFTVPADARGRFGPHWTPPADDGRRDVYDAADGQWARPPAFPDGADGLVSTVDDLAAFAEMLRSGGRAPDGTRVLSGPAVAGMTTEQAGPVDDEDGGWGLGIGVRRRDEPGGRSAGAFGWDGGLGGTWWTDPVTGVSATLLTNQMWASPQPPAVFDAFRALAFGA